MIIAVDGTLASGKGTLAKRLSAHYRLPHMDTGLLYRATGYLAHSVGVDLDDAQAVANLAASLSLADFDEAVLRTDTVAEYASRVAVLSPVRAALLALQRDFAGQPQGAVLDGRDIGTVICPQANVKFWVDAAPEIRAKRRLLELESRGIDDTFDNVLAGLMARDTRDANRADAPMARAQDAYVLDTSDLTPQQALANAMGYIDQPA